MGDLRLGHRLSNSGQLLEPALFSHDMKLHSISVCTWRDRDRPVSIEFTLRTLASKIVKKLQLAKIGNEKVDVKCSDWKILDANHVEFVEVTFEKFITSVIVKVDNGDVGAWGQPSISEKVHRWTFTPD